VVGGAEAESARELIDRALKAGIVERHEPSALVAQQVMVVVLAGGIGGLIASDPIADVDAADEFVGVEELEDPVDAGPPHGSLAAPAATQGVFDLQRAEGAVLAGQEVDELVAGGAAMVSRPLEHGASVRRPVGVGARRHLPKLRAPARISGGI
jgi:hypothetical protein